MKNIIEILGIKHDLVQYRFWRKFYCGTWYKIRTNLSMADFWTDKEIISCQSRIIKIENHKCI